MAVLQRPDLLALVALGSNGGQPLLDGSAMAAGVHLQWQPKGGLGFPTGGFDVHRRTTPQGQQTCATFGQPFSPPGDSFSWMGFGFVASPGTVAAAPGGCAGTGALSLPGTRTLDATPPWPARMLQITVEGSGPQLVASAWWEVDGESVPVARGITALVGGNRVVTLFADRMDRIRIEGPDLVICKVCGVEAMSGVTTGWGAPLNAAPIVLPVTDAAWPTTHPNSPNDQLEAEARLPAALPTSQRTRYSQAFQVALHSMLVDMVRTVPQSSWAVGGPGASPPGDSRPAPSMQLPGLSTLALHAVDPNVARMLGLYFVDATAVAGTFCDYKVVGHYGNQRWPGDRFTFDDLEPGRLYIRPLDRGGLTLYSGRPMVIASETWAGIAQTAVRMDMHPVLRLPLWAVLPASTPAVSIRIKSTLGATAKTWLGATLVSTLSIPAGEQEVHLEPGTSFDRVSVDNTSGFFLFELVVREQAGFVGDVTAVTFRHQPSQPPGVRPLTLAGYPLPLASGFRSDGSFNESPNAAGLAWSEPPASFPLRNAGLPVLVEVTRDDRGTGATPGPITASATLNAGSPALVSASSPLGLQPDGWPSVQLHFVDRGVPDGWYDYRVRGVAMFGRLGPFSAPATLNLRDPLAPPTPAAFRASYVDDDQPNLATGELADRVAGTSVFDVTWIWSGRARLHAPDVEAGGEFRVYRYDGERDRLSGTVTSVAVSGSTSMITTDQTWAGAVDALANERIRVAGTWFKVVANTSGPTFALLVQNLEGPTEVPSTGAFLLPFRSDGPNATDWRTPPAWSQRIHVQSARSDGRVSGTITAVSPEGVITTDATLADPDGVLLPGVLVSGGQAWDASDHDTGGLVVTIAARSRPDESLVLRAVGSAFTYVAGIRHAVQVPATLAPGATSGVAVAWLGISASDGKAHAADDPLWSLPGRGGLGGRPGNESVVTPPQRVFATRHATPAPPSVPTSTGPIYAEPADYHGVARYTLSWNPHPEPEVTGHLVHRASGASLFLRDVQQRRTPSGIYVTEGPLGEDFGLGASAWFTAEYPALTIPDLSGTTEEIDAVWRAFAAWFHPQLSDAQIQTLANLVGNDTAFARVTGAAVAGTSLEDAFDGRGTGFLVYKVQAVDASGNRSPLSDAFPPVHLRDVTPPAQPVLLSAVGGDKRVTLRWRANEEPDIASYKVWRDTNAALVSDVRRSVPFATVTASTMSTVHEWLDDNVDALTSYHYRIAARDHAGNDSEATPTCTVRPTATSMPRPPVWTRGEWIRFDGVTEYDYADPSAAAHPAMVALAWTVEEAEVSCMLQRRQRTDRTWREVGTVTPSPTNPLEHAYRDPASDPAAENEYRVRVTDTAGNYNAYLQAVRVVPAVE